MLAESSQFKSSLSMLQQVSFVQLINIGIIQQHIINKVDLPMHRLQTSENQSLMPYKITINDNSYFSRKPLKNSLMKSSNNSICSINGRSMMNNENTKIILMPGIFGIDEFPDNGRNRMVQSSYQGSEIDDQNGNNPQESIAPDSNNTKAGSYQKSKLNPKSYPNIQNSEQTSMKNREEGLNLRERFLLFCQNLSFCDN